MKRQAVRPSAWDDGANHEYDDKGAQRVRGLHYAYVPYSDASSSGAMTRSWRRSVYPQMPDEDTVSVGSTDAVYNDDDTNNDGHGYPGYDYDYDDCDSDSDTGSDHRRFAKARRACTPVTTDSWAAPAHDSRHADAKHEDENEDEVAEAVISGSGHATVRPRLFPLESCASNSKTAMKRSHVGHVVSRRNERGHYREARSALNDYDDDEVDVYGNARGYGVVQHVYGDTIDRDHVTYYDTRGEHEGAPVVSEDGLDDHYGTSGKGDDDGNVTGRHGELIPEEHLYRVRFQKARRGNTRKPLAAELPHDDVPAPPIQHMPQHPVSDASAAFLHARAEAERRRRAAAAAAAAAVAATAEADASPIPAPGAVAFLRRRIPRDVARDAARAAAMREAARHEALTGGRDRVRNRRRARAIVYGSSHRRVQ